MRKSAIINRRSSVALTALLLALTGTSLRADDIRLASGEILSGKVLSTDAKTVRFLHPVLGELSLPAAQITILPKDAAARAAALKNAPAPMTPEAIAAANPASAQVNPNPAPAPTPAPTPAKPKDPESFWEGWKGTVDLGLNGSAGNSENFSLRGAVGLKRTTEPMETAVNFSYIYATDDGRATKSRAEASIRNDWLFKDSPWGFFAQGKFEFDDFQSWLYRVSAFAGPSYTFIKNDTTLLRGRVGFGLSREIMRRADNAITPEALAGLDFEHKLNDRTKVFANVDYLPSLKRFTTFRIDSKAGLEILLDKDSGMNFKLGAADRYQSNPGPGAKRNDIDYFATLGWNF